MKDIIPPSIFPPLAPLGGLQLKKQKNLKKIKKFNFGFFFVFFAVFCGLARNFFDSAVRGSG